uniref:NADH-ubiquinone oxidoreductase chain 6 n=1 Tax=Lathrobium brunnipes TaxID=346787 RepID=A0A0S2M7H5_9COLE|nr:NADH deshydrogenase subunit 6 [Lathrobium brunnipes]
MMILSLTLSMIFLFMNHPMSMGMILLSQTILTSMITGFLSFNFWFSYILFLVMIGGMLVLFIYMTSIASNEIFKYSNFITLLIMVMIMTMVISYIFIDKFLMNYFNFNQDIMLNYNFNLSLNKFINYPSNLVLFTIIIYLFITLIAVVKITSIKSGPLRQKF